MLRSILLILLCYALGSFSPSHLLGRLKGIELRKHGTKNLGASNALFILGKAAAMITLLIDAGKGAAAVWIGWYASLPALAIYACALAAIIGHMFPFYLQFRGGKGVAACIGAALGLVMVPSALRQNSLPHQQIFVLILIGYAIMMMCYSIIKHKQPDVKPGRKLARLLALAFPLAYYFTAKTTALWIVGAALCAMLLLDIIRLASKRFNNALFHRLAFFMKKKERHAMSSTTALLISLAASIAFFDSKAVLIVSSMFIVSDAVAEIVGKSFGRHPLYGGKTVEGTAGGLASSLLIAIVLYGFLNTPFSALALAAIITTSAEALSAGIDDNLTTIALSSFLISALGIV